VYFAAVPGVYRSYTDPLRRSYFSLHARIGFVLIRSGSSTGAFADTDRVLNNHIGIFTNLPVMSLDRVSLQGRLGHRQIEDRSRTRERLSRGRVFAIAAHRR
jgi:hypothetical protein